MIKKVTLVRTIEDKFPINVDLLKLEPPLENAEYIIGGFYKTKGYSMYAFYVADENGNVLENKPLIHDEGRNSYAEIFQEFGYLYI